MSGPPSPSSPCRPPFRLSCRPAVRQEHIAFPERQRGAESSARANVDSSDRQERGVEEPNPDTHPAEFQKRSEHVARFDGREGEQIELSFPVVFTGESVRMMISSTRLSATHVTVPKIRTVPPESGLPAGATTVTRFLFSRRVRRLALTTGY